MGKIVEMTKKTGKVKNNVKVRHSFTDAVECDIERLCTALSCTREQAIKTASDFYLQYPMLVEHVRSPEFMLRK